MKNIIKGIAESKTTMSQYLMAVPLSVLLVVTALVSDRQMVVVGPALTMILPLILRALLYWKPEAKLPTTDEIRERLNEISALLETIREEEKNN